MSPLLDRVFVSISRYNMFPSGARVGIAVSGGADSTCLLHVLRELGMRWNLSLHVLHLNHRLRGAASDADAGFVREMAARLGVLFHEEAVEVRGLDRNLEQAGRRARLQFFARARSTLALDRVALGHTRNDQAETVLFRLLRGSGTAGLAGVRPVTSDGRVRPLIDCERAEIEAFLRERSISWREDASNSDYSFVRNRLRRDLLPTLIEDYNPALLPTLARTAMIALDEEQFWSQHTLTLANRFLRWNSPAALCRTDDLLGLSKAEARRLLRYAVRRVKGDLRGLEAMHIEALLAMAAEGEGHGRLQLPGLDVFRSFDWLRIDLPRTTSRAERDYQLPVSVPGRVEIPGAGLLLAIELVKRVGSQPDVLNCGYNTDGCELDGDLIDGPLELRNWRPGDCYERVGHSNEKVKTLFQRERVPIWDRQGWPILTSGDRIVWVKQFGPAAAVAPTAQTRRILRVSEVGKVAPA